MNDHEKQMIMEDKPIWVSISGYEGYDINQYGVIRSYWKNCGGRGKGMIKMNEPVYIKKQHYHLSGYLQLQLKDKTVCVHRLLAIAFIPNPHNFPEVDHIDRNKTNNSLINLRWCDRTTNSQNRGIFCTNTSGTPNVCFDNHCRLWKFSKTVNGITHQKNFKTKEEAVQYAVIYNDKLKNEKKTIEDK